MPTPHIPDDRIKSGKQFADFAIDLLDSEIQQAMAIVVSLQRKYAKRPNTADQLEALRDEALTRLADIGILATLDPAPCFYGEPPILEFIGKVNTDVIHKEGFDHEQKQYEVRKATKRGENFLGEKDRVNTRQVKDKK